MTILSNTGMLSTRVAKPNGPVYSVKNLLKCLIEIFSKYSDRRLTESRTIKSASSSNQILLVPSYLNSTQNTSVI